MHLILLSLVRDALTALLILNPDAFAGPEGADRAELHVDAAEYAAKEVDDPRITPSLLLAMARVESNYDPTATSRMVNGVRVTGMWRSTRPTGHGKRFCGPLQTIAGDRWVDCLAQRDLYVGYLTGAKEMVFWLGAAERYRVPGDRLRAALRGHGCGIYGFRGPCNRYDVRVLRERARLEKLVQGGHLN